MTDHDTGTAQRQHRPPDRPRRAADIVRHAVDGISAPAAFLVIESRRGPEWGAVVALLVALVIGVIRRRRGDPLTVVTVATAIVAFHSVSAIGFGEGRAFYFPELVINAAGLLACAVTLMIGRPVTEILCRRIGTEPAHTAHDPAARRRHRRLTAGWAVLWLSHLVLLGHLYAIDSLVGLTLLSALFCKPTVLAMAILTAVTVRRAVREHLAPPHRKDPS
ncbi:DUF3159 domain-containing protein [Streptomyces sp. SID5785]|uniref:DUF3159 domain-containing protein n=1 Tax=Streptomyces sp. SID5785 TaxID=2690309 RepID=UPI001360D2AC|nr:DUF3159 domain-containing protein [Streptomyces sp. SID5785]MZD09872.1 DUF3159 domain-containing protein [Streptomyces sp. SID5785]